MVGGNLQGVTRTVSIAIYDHVQAFEYREPTITALFMLAFAFAILSPCTACKNGRSRWPQA